MEGPDIEQQHRRQEDNTSNNNNGISDSQVISKVTSVVSTGAGGHGNANDSVEGQNIIKTNGQQHHTTTLVLAAGGHPHQHHHHHNAIVGTGGGTSSSIAVAGTAANNTNHHHSLHHHHGSNKTTVPTVATASSQPSMVTGGGSMSIVQFQLPNQTTTMVQSVIQPNHQSVIQPTNSISTIQLPKNVILVNKLAPSSVIQSTESESSLSLVKEETESANQIYEDECKRRREILARRPSYRKILSELSATEAAAVASNAAVGASPSSSGGTGSNIVGDSSKVEEERGSPPQPPPPPSASQTSATVGAAPSAATAATISLPSYIKMLPSIQIGSQDGTTIQSIPTIMTNTNTGSSTIVQYASGHDGQFIVPADLQTYQLRPPANPSAIAQNVVMTSQNVQSQPVDEAMKKREMRLLKNREAAKECRRKKKEYIKCLENRVAVLENQNKALIDELKTLKELYCKKSD